MTDLEKYNKAFTETFGVADDELPGMEYRHTAGWDSVGHMMLMAAIGEAFGIILSGDDIVDFSSYEKGKYILAKNYGVDFQH